MRSRPRVVPIPLGIVKAFLLQDQGAILVDTGPPGSAPRIQQALAQEGLNLADLSLILITHGHTDHFGSVAALQEGSSAPVAVSRADAGALRQGTNVPLQARTSCMRLLQRMGGGIAQTAPPCEPDILLEGRADLASYGVEAEVIPTPGHTSGSVSILLPDGQALVGDLIMGGFVGRGRPGYPLVWDDPEAYQQSLRELLATRPTCIHTSHGGPFTLEEVQARLGQAGT